MICDRADNSPRGHCSEAILWTYYVLYLLYYVYHITSLCHDICQDMSGECIIIYSLDILYVKYNIYIKSRLTQG